MTRSPAQAPPRPLPAPLRASQARIRRCPAHPRDAISLTPATASPLARLSAHTREINRIVGCIFDRGRHV
jgi:hypothetical protein